MNDNIIYSTLSYSCVFCFLARTMMFRARTSLIKTQFDGAERRSLKSTCRKRDRQREVQSHSCRLGDARNTGCYGLKNGK